MTEQMEQVKRELRKNAYDKKSLLRILANYKRMIERDRAEHNGRYQSVVLDDIYSSVKFILEVNEYEG